MCRPGGRCGQRRIYFSVCVCVGVSRRQKEMEEQTIKVALLLLAASVIMTKIE